MAKAKNRKNAQAKNSDKLKMLKDLPTCMVVLHNIALDKDLVQLYQLRFSEKKKEELEHSSPCINTSENSFNNVWMLKENIREDTVDKTSRITRSCLRKLSKKKNKECKNLEFLSDVSYNRCHEIIQPTFVAHEQQLKLDTSVKSFSSKSYDETSSDLSSNTYCSHTQEKIVPISNKSCNDRRPGVQKKNGSKRKAYFDQSGTSLESVKISSDESHLNEENLATNYNTKMQDTCDETLVPQMISDDTEHCSIKKCNNNNNNSNNNNNLCTTGITNRTIIKLKLQQCEKNPSKALLSNIINKDNKVQSETSGETSEDIETNFKSKNTNLFDNCFTTYNNMNGSQNQKDAKKKSSDTSLATDSTIQATDVSKSLVLKSVYSTESKTNHVTTTLPDFFTTYVEQCANKINDKTIVKKLPKITENHILPKGTIRIMKVNTSDKNLQNSFSEQGFLEQNKYNDTNDNAKQVSYVDNTLESTNILREKECRTDEMDRSSLDSIDTLKISEPTLTLNNNINLRNKNIDDNKLSSKIYHEHDFSMEVRSNIHNNVNAYDTNSGITYEDISNQEQSNKLDNDEKYENFILQHDKKYITNTDESSLDKTISNLDVSENCNVKSSILKINTDKEEFIRQNRKRIAEKNMDIKFNNKKKRLNRTIWLQNNVYAKSLEHQQFNDFPNINTMVIESNIAEKNNSKNQKTDLRERLNKKKLKKSSELSTSENKFNNKNNVESKQIDLNNENDTITSTNTMRDEEFHRRFSFNKDPVSTKTLCKDKIFKDIQMDPACNNPMHCYNPLQDTLKETQHVNQMDRHIHEDTNIQKGYMTDENEDDNNDDDNDNDCDNDNEDCISLFAESFDTTLYLCDNTILSEKKSSKSLHSDAPYVMTNSSFNKYVTQNATEFNKEYAKYEQNNVEMSNKTNESEFNNQLRQTIHTDCVSETTTATKVIPTEVKNVEVLRYQYSKNIKNLVMGYCFSVLRKNICYKRSKCTYKHDLQDLINAVCLEDSKTILNMMQDTLYHGYNFLFGMIYVKSLQKLTMEHILIMYRKFHDIYTLKNHLSIFSKNYMTQNIIIELLNRQMSLKTIVDCLMEHIVLTSNNLITILTCVEKYIKHGEYWNTVRTLVLRLLPNVSKHIIQEILVECTESEKFTDIQDVNDNLINKVPPVLISELDKDIVERFKKGLLAEKTGDNSCPEILIQNFGESLPETIASPDGNTNLSQTESPKHSDILIDKSVDENNDHITKVNGETYKLRPIDNLPDARSVYRDHEHLWKFYVDLDRFKKGLTHHDYDYVINILKSYAERQDETSLFVRSCCSMLRAEIKRSEYHVANIVRRTGNKYFNT